MEKCVTRKPALTREKGVTLLLLDWMKIENDFLTKCIAYVQDWKNLYMLGFSNNSD